MLLLSFAIKSKSNHIFSLTEVLGTHTHTHILLSYFVLRVHKYIKRTSFSVNVLNRAKGNTVELLARMMDVGLVVALSELKKAVLVLCIARGYIINTHIVKSLNKVSGSFTAQHTQKE